jgi:hypothetical protein
MMSCSAKCKQNQQTMQRKMAEEEVDTVVA